MRIEIIVKSRARANLVRLLEARAPFATDGLLQAQIFIEDIREQLKDSGEPPAGARVIRILKKGFWWLYIDGIWLGFRTEVARYGVFKRSKRTVTLHSVVGTRSRA